MSDRMAKFNPSAQTPKAKFARVPFLMVTGLVFETLVPAKKPIPIAMLSPPPPVKVKPFRSRITGPDMEVEMVIAATF